MPDQFYINYWAVLVSAIANLIVGAFWYSPLLFDKAWMKENNFTGQATKQKFNPLKMYGISCILSMTISYNPAFFLGEDKVNAIRGALAGSLAGFGFSALIFAVIALFEQRSGKYVFINGGYIIIYFTLIGLIIGAWR